MQPVRPIFESAEDAEVRAALEDPHGPAAAALSHSRAKLGVFFWISVGWASFVVLLALFANFLPLENPHNNPFIPKFGTPNWAHWLGTDDQGRDILSRVIYGSRFSLVVGFGATAVGLFCGGTLGMIAAWRRKTIDNLLNFVMLYIYVIPGIVVLIALSLFWRPVAAWKLVVVIGVLSMPLFFRVIRTATLSVATRDFVQIATLQGARTRRIVLKELLPNIYPTAMSFFIIGIAGVVVLEGSLAFLGLSVSPNINPTWGNMISESFQAGNYPQTIWLVLSPAFEMCTFLLALNFIGDRLRTYFEVTEAKIS
jgi:peptide/nickel transport system permease protein